MSKLMPEYVKVRDSIKARIQEYLQDPEAYEQCQAWQSVVSGLRMALEELDNGFNWSRNGGISGYINTLDYYQLHYAKGEIDKLIKAKEEEEKITLYHVTTHGRLINKSFLEADYPQALDHYIEMIKKHLADPSRGRPGDVQLLKERVRQSEVAEYFEE